VCVCRCAAPGGDAAAALGVGIRVHAEPPLRQVQEHTAGQHGTLVSIETYMLCYVMVSYLFPINTEMSRNKDGERMRTLKACPVQKGKANVNKLTFDMI